MMKRWIIAILGLCCASTLPHAQGNDPERNFGIIPTRSVWSGVYSAAQASRGEYAYADDECGVCHGENLDGDSGITELAGADFMADWEGESVLELVRHMHSMPIGDRDDIGIVEATDLTAFLLRENNIPAGSGDLPVDPRILAGIRMDARNPDAK
jgi:hypothetical protein